VKRLEIELIELTEASCCGATHLQDFDDFLALTLNARNLAYAEALGLDLITVCNTCQMVLSAAADRLRNDAALLKRINLKLAEVGLRYNGTTRVRHFLYALREDYGFANLPVAAPLEGQRIAPFYGCHNLRPSDLSADDPYRPTALDELIVALGATSVDCPRKSRCCGFHAGLQAPETTYKLSGEVVKEAEDFGAEMIVTPCPLCQLSFDAQRTNVEKAVIQHYLFHGVQKPRFGKIFHGIPRGTDDQALFQPLHRALRGPRLRIAVGKAKGPNPVKPALEFCRNIGPKNRVDKNQGIALADLFLLRRHIRLYRQIPAIKGFPAVFIFAHVGFEIHPVQIGKNIPVAGALQPLDKGIPDFPGKRILAGMGINDKGFFHANTRISEKGKTSNRRCTTGVAQH
jgi:succinate dehydrogenase / fumarate reductase cytochrome b subunit